MRVGGAIWRPARFLTKSSRFYCLLFMSKQNNGKAKADKKQRSKGRPNRQRRERGVAGLDFKSLNPLSVSAPVASSRMQRTSKPKMTTMKNGDCRISHREYITDIVAGAGSPSAFAVQALSVNPGQVGTFQWLSRIAANYESYKFSRLKFDYATEAPSSLGGTLVLALDYDAEDAAPVSKQQAMSYRSSVRSAPWAPCQHTSLGEDLSKSKTNFVRPGAQPAGTDIKTYDIGNLFIISQGVTTASAALGELWVEYDVLLMTPVFENGGQQVAVGGSLYTQQATSAANPFGPAANFVDAQNYGFTVNDASRLTFQFGGYYLVVLNFTGTGLVDSKAAVSGGVVVAGSDYPNAAATAMISIWIVTANGPGGYADITLTATTVAQGASMQVAVAPLNSLDEA